MAQRFGGKYSPDGSQDASKPKTASTATPYAGAKPASAGARVNLLFLAPLPLILSLFGDGAFVMARNMAALAVLLLAAWLLREGLKAQEAYDARTIAKPPALPRKLLASILTGFGLLAASLGQGPIAAVVIGLVGAALHSFSFGIDPMRSKGAEGIDQFQQDRVARVVDEAEKHLTTMTTAIKRVGDRQLEGRVERFQSTARQMFRTVEEDPRDLTSARKFLGVYLMGAKDATVKFADIYTRTPDAEARQKYLELLDDMDSQFTAKTETLLKDNNSDLDIEIKVLRDRLRREGIKTD